MVMLFRAILGFAMAVALLNPSDTLHRFETMRFATLKAELAAEHPAEKLKQLLSRPLPHLRGDDPQDLH